MISRMVSIGFKIILMFIFWNWKTFRTVIIILVAWLTICGWSWLITPSMVFLSLKPIRFLLGVWSGLIIRLQSNLTNLTAIWFVYLLAVRMRSPKAIINYSRHCASLMISASVNLNGRLMRVLEKSL